MAGFTFVEGQKAILDGTIDLETDTLIAVLVQNTTTADVENIIGKKFLGDIGTLDRSDGSGYADETLANVGVTMTGTKAVASCDDFTYSALGAATADHQGYIVAVNGANDAARRLISWVPFSSDRAGDGADFPVEVDLVNGFIAIETTPAPA